MFALNHSELVLCKHSSLSTSFAIVEHRPSHSEFVIVVGFPLRPFLSLRLVLLGHEVEVKEREWDYKLARGIAGVTKALSGTMLCALAQCSVTSFIFTHGTRNFNNGP